MACTKGNGMFKVKLRFMRRPSGIYEEMHEFCNSMTDHFGYQSGEFMFVFEEHRTWFVLKFSEYLEPIDS